MEVLLVIRMMSNGQLTVTGPLHEKMTCYGMLELAKDVIRNHRPPSIALADGSPLPDSLFAPPVPPNGDR